MPVTILLPTALQRLTDGRDRVEVEAATVGGALQALAVDVPNLSTQLLDKNGAIRSFVNVYLGDEDTRFLQGPATPLAAGDTLTIVPSIAGG